ncbi:MAG: RDD family protein [Pseudomonadota bacterium]
MTPNQHPPEYVGFWIRFLAFVIDNIAAMLVLGVIVAILFGTDVDPQDVTGLFARSLLQSLLVAALFIGLWIYFASTPGKMIFDAYIVDAKTLGNASRGQLVIRYLGYIVSTLLFFLGFVWIAFDARKQGLHDKMAGTLVIKGKPRQ